MTIQEQKKHYLHNMGIQTWSTRSSNLADEVPLEQTVQHGSASNWQDLQAQVNTCQQCPLGKTRTNAVFGVGSKNANIMIIGEAPGYYEDQQGEPFVGRAGQLLNQMLRAIGLKREQVFIANILKCRPPENRDPLPQEIRTCTQYLTQQIEHIKPKLIVAVGRIAGQYLLDSSESMRDLRKNTHDYQGTPLLVTYHAAYLLRTRREKANAYLDLLRIKQYTL